MHEVSQSHQPHQRPDNLPAWWTSLGQHANWELYKSLVDVVQPEALQKWIDTSVDALGGATPASLIKTGQVAPLQELIWKLASGHPG